MGKEALKSEDFVLYERLFVILLSNIVNSLQNLYIVNMLIHDKER